MTSATAGHDLAVIWADWWWAIILFGGSALEFMGESFDVGISALRRRSRRRHKRRMQLKRLELEIARTQAGVTAPAAVKPGPCVHRNVTPVVSPLDEVVAWLCKSCETRLPADWAVREEDL